MPRLQAWAPSQGGEQEFQTPTTGVAPNGLPYFSWDQGAVQLNRGGNVWNTTLGTPVTITYGFRESGAPPPGTGVSGFQQFNAIQIEVTEQLLQRWSEVANITFVRVGTGYTNNATMLFGNFVTGPAQFSAFAYLPAPGGMDPAFVNGDVWVNISRDYDANPRDLQRGAQILLHEIGHTFGLLHPSDYDGGAQSGVTYNLDADFWQDTRQFTVQSYFSETHTGASYGEYWVTSPQMFDIAAAQRLFGANMTTRTGDTVYGFHSNTGIGTFSLTSSTQGAIFCIWDAGGNDTIDLSGYGSESEIDLRPESFSSAGGHSTGPMIGNISIARGVTIENAIGGAGNDTITGNTVANRLTGNAGHDAINGGEGVDTSVYSIASTSATWTRNPNGTWTVTGEGNDALTSVEVLDFTNRDVVLDNAQQTFSADGTSDILWLRNDGLTATWAMSGTAQIGGTLLGSVGNEWSIQGTGDFSGDGRDDILWHRNDGLVYLWNNASSAGAVFVAAASTAWDIQGVGDFNFDGRDDFLWRNPTTGQVAIWTLNGSTVTNQAAIGAAGAEWSIQTVADFSGDGRDDILWRRDDGLMAIWNTDGSGVTGSSIVGSVGAEWTASGSGDFNGDGYADILWQRDDGLMAIWEMNNSGLLASGLIGGVGTTWHVADVGDYNGDGRDDIFWRNDDGLLAVWTLNGFTVTSTGVTGSVGAEWGII